jgi:sulfur-carrier protein
MPVVWIPALLRDMTGGETAVTMPGATVKQVIEHLDERYPGMQARLCQGDRLRPNIAVVIDGEVYRSALQHQLTETSEIWFLPALSGGGSGGCCADPDLGCSHDDGSPLARPCPEAGTSCRHVSRASGPACERIFPVFVCVGPAEEILFRGNIQSRLGTFDLDWPTARALLPILAFIPGTFSLIALTAAGVSRAELNLRLARIALPGLGALVVTTLLLLPILGSSAAWVGCAGWPRSSMRPHRG